MAPPKTLKEQEEFQRTDSTSSAPSNPPPTDPLSSDPIQAAQDQFLAAINTCQKTLYRGNQGGHFSSISGCTTLVKKSDWGWEAGQCTVKLDHSFDLLTWGWQFFTIPLEVLEWFETHLSGNTSSRPHYAWLQTPIRTHLFWMTLLKFLPSLQLCYLHQRGLWWGPAYRTLSNLCMHLQLEWDLHPQLLYHLVGHFGLMEQFNYLIFDNMLGDPRTHGFMQRSMVAGMGNVHGFQLNFLHSYALSLNPVGKSIMQILGYGSS